MQRRLELGLHSELIAPLILGARPIGMVSLSRQEADAFTNEEVELVSLLGRLVATAVQNIRSYEAERQTVEELRRLSALRADFVSLVSHELRSPMAAVIGAARTLQDRWRTLAPEQREAFLALIGDETNRLAALTGDVLDQGPGVPLGDRRLIFEKFGRSTTGQSKPGTGLGLFIARSIAEAHGGGLEVTTPPTEPGATFTLLLPVGESATDA